MKLHVLGLKINQPLTKAICNKGFSGNSNILPRSNFGVSRQVSSPQSLTAYSLDRYGPYCWTNFQNHQIEKNLKASDRIAESPLIFKIEHKKTLFGDVIIDNGTVINDNDIVINNNDIVNNDNGTAINNNGTVSNDNGTAINNNGTVSNDNVNVYNDFVSEIEISVT